MKLKCCVAVIVFLALALSTLQAALHGPEDSNAWSMLAQARRQSDEIDALNARTRAFARRLADVCEQVEEGRLSLAHAVPVVEAAAVAEHPDYLCYLLTVEEGDTLHEKIACNILRHFRAHCQRQNTSALAHALARCELELRAYLGHAPESRSPFH